ncbi:MAG: type II and III secretion system protein family protein [Candidatus Binataceae bacterium]
MNAASRKGLRRLVALIAALAMLVLSVSTFVMRGRALAAKVVTLDLQAGETYIIHDVDPDTPAVVSYAYNSNSFTVKRGGLRALTLFTFQPGRGTIQVTAGGEDVTYRVVVSGLINGVHPLWPGTAPPALSDKNASTLYASAAVAKDSGAAGHPGNPERGAVAATAASPGIGPSNEARTTKTETVGPAFPGGAEASSQYLGGDRHNADPASANPPATASQLSPNVAGSTASQWHEQPFSVISRQYSTNPRAVRPEGYVTNRAFGGRHNLPPDTISITAGTSQVYDFGGPISRVSMANTRVADVQVLGTHQLMIVGHQPGFSSLVVWDSQGNYVERQIWTEIAGHQQVMLNAIVAEVDLNRLEQMGANVSVALTQLGLTFVSLPGLVGTPFTAANTSIGPTSMVPGGSALPLLFSQNLTYAIAGQNSNVSTFAFFQFLEEHDLGRILARPQLLANSGEKARFLSGGEIPIVITQALTTTIVFKQYGTSVIFVPTVIGGRDIELLVRPEVSKPDYTQGVQLFGFTVPAFVTRRAETRVRLKDNQTLIIAGLILDDSRATVQKVPYLGDLPFLGALFRQTYWNHEKTELVMAVTPEIVHPLPPGGEVALPTQRQGPLTPAEVQTRPLVSPDAARPRF